MCNKKSVAFEALSFWYDSTFNFGMPDLPFDYIPILSFKYNFC